MAQPNPLNAIYHELRRTLGEPLTDDEQQQADEAHSPRDDHRPLPLAVPRRYSEDGAPAERPAT